jgi:hypothetical protein
MVQGLRRRRGGLDHARVAQIVDISVNTMGNECVADNHVDNSEAFSR